MKVLSYKQDKDTQVCVCGVDGAGKKSFVSVFFPKEATCKQQSSLKISKQTEKLLAIVILDGVHLQNMEEEDVITQISEMCKRNRGIKISILFVLNKVDLIYNRRQNPTLVNDIYTSYQQFFEKIKCHEIKFIAFSYLATKIFHELLSREIDDDDCDDANMMLAKIGKTFSKHFTPDQMKQYLISHKNVFKVFSGETLIKRFIERWKEK